MKNLTNNKFKFGAISQKIIRNIWRKNKLITYKQFSELWITENNIGIKYPKLAYNEFMKINSNKDEWHQNKKEILIIFQKYKLL
jgi:ribosomal protein L20